MLKQRRMAAEHIAGALFEAETAIDEAISKAANFAGSLPTFRKAAGASALIGQEAIARASHAIVALAEARQQIVEAHKELSVAQGQVGLGAVAFDGGDGDKPPIGIETELRNLRPVRAA